MGLSLVGCVFEEASVEFILNKSNAYHHYPKDKLHRFR